MSSPWPSSDGTEPPTVPSGPEPSVSPATSAQSGTPPNVVGPVSVSAAGPESAAEAGFTGGGVAVIERPRPPAWADEPGGEIDAPSRSDVVVHGLAEAIGGPLGDHATPRRRAGRFWTASTIVISLLLLTLVGHWAQKSGCQDGNWNGLKQYRHMCYTDVLALYYAEGLSDGKVPYADHAVEYPVLTGVFMGLLGLPVHAYAVNHPSINAGEWFYLINLLVLSLIAVVSVAVMLRHARAPTLGHRDVRRRPGAAAHRERQLGPAGRRLRGIRHVGLGPPPSVAGRGAARSGYRRQALARLPVHPAAAARAALAPLPAGLLRVAGRGGHLAGGQPAGGVPLPGLLARVLPPQLHPGGRLGHAVVRRRAHPAGRPPARLPLPFPAHQHAEHGDLRAVRARLPGHRAAGLPGPAPAAPGPAGVPGGGLLPGVLQGLVAAVRAVAAAAGRAGPPQAGAPSWPGSSPRSATSARSTAS